MKPIIAGSILATVLFTSAQAGPGECDDPAVIDAAQYHMMCDDTSAPAQSENGQIIKDVMAPVFGNMKGCDLYGKLYDAKTWAALSHLSDEQIIEAIDREVTPSIRKQLEALPKNEATEVVVQGLRSTAIEIGTLSLHSITSFTPSTVQYDLQQHRYLCRAKVTHVPNYTQRLERWFFIEWLMQTNSRAYEQVIMQNNTQAWNIIESDAQKVGLAMLLSTGAIGRSCDTEIRDYTVQTISTGFGSTKILVTAFPDACKNTSP